MIARRRMLAAAGAALFLSTAVLPAQQNVVQTRDPRQQMDEDFARFYKQWTTEPRYGSPLVDHLPKVAGIPSPKDVLGYYIGAPKTLTYYADILKYYRALDAASPRVWIESIGKSDEGRELVVIWVSSEENIKNLAQNRANLAKIADPRGRSDNEIRALIDNTKPHYHLIGGLHSGETGPPEMLMELAYRLAVETSPVINQIRSNVYVSITPAAEPDGRDRNIDWFYRGLEMQAQQPPAGRDSARVAADSARARGAGGDSAAARPQQPPQGPGVPYWGKYVFHDNNRDINLSQMSMRALTDWYYTAHPPIMHDLHESLTLLYTYSGGPPQNPNLDPLLFGELSWFANWELSQMTKWGMPGVYTHAFMDGWSPGYLGSVAYNHNGMMKMYETQSGRDVNIDSVRAALAKGDTARAAAPSGGGGGGGGGGPQGAGSTQAPPTGRGGGQAREWYRGIPVPPNAVNNFTRRNNANYMQTGVLSSLQLTSMFPQLILENFYTKTRNSLEATEQGAPYAYAIPVQREMTKVTELLKTLRAQGIEVSQLTGDYRQGADTIASGSYLIKLNQPYGRLAKNLLERQDYPDPRLRTYDDSGWSMGHAFNVDVKEIKDKAILNARTRLIEKPELQGKVNGSGSAALAVAHYGSNNMIAFRYQLKNVAMKVAEKEFTADGVKFPAGSFVVSGSAADLQAARTAAESLGLTAAALSAAPTIPTHDADVPRVAIYSNWGNTQELGWYRHAFDKFGIPFDLIYKERVMQGDLKRDYDVIVMAAQPLAKTNVMAPKAARPQPYKKSDKYKFLGMYGETDDMTGGFGQAGVSAFEKFLENGGTLITTLQAVRFPIEFGFARSVDTESPTGVNAQKPLIQAEIKRPEHPVFYGYEKKIFPIKFGQGQQVFRVGIADQGNVLATFVGGKESVLSGLMDGADNIKGRAFAVDIPNAHMGKGRVLMFANNPIYRWQNHGEFNMVFNSIINWNDVVTAPAATTVAPVSNGAGRD